MTEEQLLSATTRSISLTQAGPLAEQIGHDEGLQRNCAHEAGHAVIAMSFARWPHEVFVKSDGSGAVVWAEKEDNSLPAVLDADFLQCVERLAEGAGLGLDMAQLADYTRRQLTRHWSLVRLLAISLSSRLIGAERAAISRSELKKMWQFHVERLDFENQKTEKGDDRDAIPEE